MHQLNPESGAYNRPCHFRFTGTLDYAALEKSINKVVKRHATLRTRFVGTIEQPFQLVDPYKNFDLPVVDLERSWPESEREQQAISLAVDETLRPFDLAAGPVMRCRLLRLSQLDHRLLLTIHHIVFDGWSEGILRNELASLYKAFLSNATFTLNTESPVKYTDYSIWQRSNLTDERLERDIAYWQKQLGNQSHVLDLPTDRSRPSVQTFHGRRHIFWLDNISTQRLKLLAQEENATLFMALITVFKVLLYRYSGQERIIVGSPLSGRESPELENTVGYFANTLPFLTDLSGGPGFRELLRRVCSTYLSIYEHRQLPFEKLVNMLDVKRDLSRSPIIQVFFQLRNYPHQKSNFPDLQVEPWGVDCGREQFDLQLDAQEESGGLRLMLRYNTDLFDDPTMTRMAVHYKNIVNEVLHAPDLPITSFSIISKEEREQLLTDWNTTAVDYPVDGDIGTLLEQQAGKTASAIALTHESRNLTYRELNERANQLANYLKTMGVGSDASVAISIKRSLDMVVGLLGVLKAGGAYVPLDPDFPKERLAFMLDDSKADVLLTASDVLDRMPATSEVNIISIDTEWGDIATQPTTCPIPDVAPDDLAYVIYTSGSTGRPKGVEITHRALSNLLWSMQRETAITTTDTVLALTTISFDISVVEILLPLIVGARIVLIGRDIAADGIQLTNALDQTKPTIVQATPATWRMLIDSGWTGSSGLKLISGGEALPRDLANELLRRGEFLWNCYGPTETTVYSTTTRVASGSDPVFIGSPIANTQCFVLDRNQQLVPIGIPGELYIGGHGVARGYRNAPGLTEAKFVTNPFGNSILYKTGDTVRRLPTGDLEFLSRGDDQIKIRGFRIELAEIETALREHPMVNDSVVLATKNQNLVAYVVPAQDEEITDQESSHWEVLQDERVSEWEHVWDTTFLDGQKQVQDPTCNTAGVTSSYTGDPIPEVETRKWVEHAAKRIVSLKPDHLLDVGCGLGRILFRVAPHCSEYWGMDFSESALKYVQTNLHLLGSHRSKVKLLKGSAASIESLDGRYFDTIVLNGVVQYFPSLEYLSKVLGSAIDRVSPGGRIFLGDIRSLPLIDAFHFSVAFSKSPHDISRDDLRQAMIRNSLQEKELLVDPAFFYLLETKIRRVSRVEILLKRGRHQNELTRFRYDVVLHIETDACRFEHNWIDWQVNSMTLTGIGERLQQGVTTLGIRNIPNYRTLPELVAAKEVIQSGGSDNTQGLHKMLDEIRASTVHPEELWEMAAELKYHAHTTWSRLNGPGYFDALLWRKSDLNNPVSSTFFDFARNRELQHLGITTHKTLLANNPLKAQLTVQMIPLLKEFLAGKLPYYMIPSTFILLDAFPLTANGKIARLTLASQQHDLSSPDAFIPPRSELERDLMQIWCEVLQVEKIGVDDDFFQLGGHSLTATQVIARVQRLLNTEIALGLIFRSPTIRQLAATIQNKNRHRTDKTKN